MLDVPQVGDIYIVRFHPGTGQELKRYRPAIVVSSAISEIDARFVLIAPLTDSKVQDPKRELVISHLSLEKPSTLLCWYLLTIDVHRLQMKLGQVDIKTQRQISQTIQSLF